MSGRPLAGKTVVVTRAKHQTSRLSAELESLGARVIELPTIAIVPPDSYEPLDAALTKLPHYQWLIVTSANAVHVLRERMELLGLTAGSFAGIRCAAIGASTAQALRDLGLPVDVTPKEYVGEALIAALREHAFHARILLARAAVARDLVPEALRQLGATVEIVDAYKTVAPPGSAASLKKVLTSSELPDAVTFTSSSTAANFFQLLRDAELARLPENIRAISIGPVTSATLRELGWKPAAEADPHDVPGLVQAVVRALA